jgi:AraC-like DNA-binding protein
MRVFIRTETRSLLWPANAPVEGPSIEIKPEGPLATHVECLRVGRGVFPREVTERVLPDGAVHLFFDVGDAYAATVTGVTSAPTVVRLSGVLEQVGVQLRTGAIATLLGVPAHELSGRATPLEAIWGRHACELLEQLAEMPPSQRVAHLRAVLLDRLRASDAAPERRVLAAVRCIRAAHGDVSVRSLAAQLDVGERRLEQLFQREVGVSAKTFCRIARLHHTIDYLLEHRGESWPEVANACGFYDQAHLIREFRAITDTTPGALAEFGFFQYGDHASS